MKKLVIIAALLANSLYMSYAGNALFTTDFTDNTTITTTGADLTHSKLTGNGDFESWMTATTYCFVESTGSITLPALTFTGGEKITVKWGIHDSGRSLELLDGTTSITTFQTTPDVIAESTFTLATDFIGLKTLSLNIVEGAVVITQITIEPGTSSYIKDAQEKKSKVFVSGKNLMVQATVGELLEVFDITGNIIYRSVSTADNQPININISGIYVVKIGTEAIKFIIE